MPSQVFVNYNKKRNLDITYIGIQALGDQFFMFDFDIINIWEFKVNNTSKLKI